MSDAGAPARNSSTRQNTFDALRPDPYWARAHILSPVSSHIVLMVEIRSEPPLMETEYSSSSWAVYLRHDVSDLLSESDFVANALPLSFMPMSSECEAPVPTVPTMLVAVCVSQ